MLRILALALGLATFAAPALAQSYPAKPLRIVVPFAAGGAVDALARVVGTKMAENWGQPVVIENKPGAGGNLAADIVAKSPPDGYTVLLTTNGLAISPSLYKALPFDVTKDFVPVTQLIASYLLLVVNPKLPAKTFQDFVALAKAKPGALNYGSTGIGNPLHLTMEMLKSAASINVQPVPYKGDAPLNTGLIAGEIEAAVVPFATGRPHVEAGTMRALATAGAKRVAALPDVPTVAESGLPGFESSSWQGFFVPAGTPRDIVLRLHQETARALAAPEVRERLKAFASDPVGSTPDEFAAMFKSEVAKFAKIVADAKIPKQD